MGTSTRENMWWEIIPSFAIVTGLLGIPSLAGRAFNRAIHDGLPNRRAYTTQTGQGYDVEWHKRDMQHSKPSWWQYYIKATEAGNGTVYKCNTLADLSLD